jgi:hypothetical protein
MLLTLLVIGGWGGSNVSLLNPIGITPLRFVQHHIESYWTFARGLLFTEIGYKVDNALDKLSKPD